MPVGEMVFMSVMTGTAVLSLIFSLCMVKSSIWTRQEAKVLVHQN